MGGWRGRGGVNLPVFTIAVELSGIGKEPSSDALLHCLLIITARLHADAGSSEKPFELLTNVPGMHQPSVVEEVLATPL